MKLKAKSNSKLKNPPIKTSECDWEQYLQKVRDALWGGDMEINALARALKVRVRVYQGDGDPVLEFGSDNADWELRITYHKYLFTSAHYNSLVAA